MLFSGPPTKASPCRSSPPWQSTSFTARKSAIARTAKKRRTTEPTRATFGCTLHDGDRVIIVEDVTTSGKSIDETYPILKAAADVDVKGLYRLPQPHGGRQRGGVVTAQQEVQEKYGFPSHPS